jgi:hypothetical protein
MRTTVTLEDDLAERIADLARETRKPFRVVLNDALRRGLEESIPPEPKFVIKPHPGHLRPGIDDRRLNELAGELDIEDFLKTRSSRKR